MANVDQPSGFTPVRHLNGNPYNGQFNMYFVTDGNAMYIGDAIKTAGSGDTLGKYGTVVRAAAGNAIRGVVIGFSNTPYLAANVEDLSMAYRLASVDMYVAVADDPDLIFEAQEDNLADTLIADDVGSIVNLVATAGSSLTGISGMEIDSSEGGQTASKTFLVMGLVDRPDNALGSYAKWNVYPLLHELRSSTGI